MSIYKWPKSVIRECERIIKNFLWTGDPNIKKLFTLKWEKVCAPLEEVGLGIRSLEVIKRALLMKLVWKIQQVNEEWALFFQAKFKMKNGELISYHKQSTIWPGLKWIMDDVTDNSRWIVGDGENISVWYDAWIKEKSLSTLFPWSEYMKLHKNQKVGSLITDK